MFSVFVVCCFFSLGAALSVSYCEWFSVFGFRFSPVRFPSLGLTSDLAELCPLSFCWIRYLPSSLFCLSVFCFSSTLTLPLHDFLNFILRILELRDFPGISMSFLQCAYCSSMSLRRILRGVIRSHARRGKALQLPIPWSNRNNDL